MTLTRRDAIKASGLALGILAITDRTALAGSVEGNAIMQRGAD